eukprot:TRINITY_DN1264_c0_g1_i1.p1 TRINITY_DN1264_c0_g1~~TRINITY_DN1264_c0_g1_i1.p1  ORF type:complete len:260 (+),score=111.24 TRINITY_DN1264_c0_g1_i1:144-923(+)
MNTSYEYFDAARKNDFRKLRDILDSGFYANEIDEETGCTALHFACAKGSKQCIELLLTAGCDPNAQNGRGQTPLHILVKNRFDNMAFFLISQGANLYVADRDRNSPRDEAPNFLQKELDAAWKLALEAKSKEKIEIPQDGKVVVTVVKQVEQAMRIYTGNGGYKTLVVSPGDSASHLVKTFLSKGGLPDSWLQWADLHEYIKGTPRKMPPGESVLDAKARWPKIISQNGDETHLHCRFVVNLKVLTPPDIVNKFNEAYK